ncbi:MAG: 16S rRNA (uracil(1498)-N(3))-methyltransferase [Chlorobi bacterium]|nr:MAG: 16S rRNA (uracil(1498)-N(3))-methyltransferase [Bacteroidota bacterium]KXK35161.1 MAG: 16S ribosomal RNA methyltransferase RsmE [Chlorobi bacterium OLB6]MBE2265826.1 16S rRNA (uracil(1498)-N(3))-methyltransferase [Flavobacteriales bacterium]MBL1160481.1 16S rRNA (uracil(1498)-N(3))-methyltransferase [Chlorobiota bacterium]MBW7853271.1 16S rRNA (uracil(1498)-N(3))-methyltransferase [Candidatus Kapabacteria bacterium]MCC6331240.1 16S rRNA (uracil(1498)-N(3))-methyltransferase [Ignavibact
MDNLYDSIPENDDLLKPSADTIQHLKSLRLRSGSTVQVLNGKGLTALCRIETPGVLRVISRTLAPEPVVTVLCLGITDSKSRIEFTVEKATELGITHIVPVHTERSQFFRTSVERLRLKCVAALMQSGNPWLPQIHEPVGLGEATAFCLQHGAKLIYGSQNAEDSNVDHVRSVPVALFIGPEGGFTLAEEAHLQRLHATAVRLGKYRLRTETAAIAMMAAVQRIRI